MMEGCPFKFRILELLEAESAWNSDLVRKLQAEYNMPSDYHRDCLNFDLIEIAASGMISEVEAKVDIDGEFKQDCLLTLYRITPIGVDLLNELRGKSASFSPLPILVLMAVVAYFLVLIKACVASESWNTVASFFQDGLIPKSEYVYMIVIIGLCIIGLWRARKMVSDI
jgi:hypothetical protein